MKNVESHGSGVEERATAGRPYGSEDGTGAPVDEAPPFLGSWRNVYLAVLATLMGWIAVGFWITAVWR
jgi:hypothetical protein